MIGSSEGKQQGAQRWQPLGRKVFKDAHQEPAIHDGAIPGNTKNRCAVLRFGPPEIVRTWLKVLPEIHVRRLTMSDDDQDRNQSTAPNYATKAAKHRQRSAGRFPPYPKAAGRRQG